MRTEGPVRIVLSLQGLGVLRDEGGEWCGESLGKGRHFTGLGSQDGGDKRPAFPRAHGTLISLPFKKKNFFLSKYFFF